MPGVTMGGNKFSKSDVDSLLLLAMAIPKCKYDAFMQRLEEAAVANTMTSHSMVAARQHVNTCMRTAFHKYVKEKEVTPGTSGGSSSSEESTDDEGPTPLRKRAKVSLGGVSRGRTEKIICTVLKAIKQGVDIGVPILEKIIESGLGPDDTSQASSTHRVFPSAPHKLLPICSKPRWLSWGTTSFVIVL